MPHNLLFVPSDTQFGVWYYRCLRPMQQMNHVEKGKWQITINSSIGWDDYAYLKQFEIIIIHNGQFRGDVQDKFWSFLLWAKENGIKTVLDIDDYWDYGKDHPLDSYCKTNAIPFKVTGSIKLVDAVTTTTEYFANIIRPYNPNVYVCENGLCNDDVQFTTKKREAKRIRFGLAGGSSHTTDIKEIVNNSESIFDYMTNAQKDKMQLVLCGFDLRGKNNICDANGNVIKVEDIPIDQIWWTKVEKLLTKDYTTVSKEYADLLKRYDHSDEAYDASNEPYRRIWTKDISKGEYGDIYKDMDILLVPLKDNDFNKCKSELKFIEAGWTYTGIIASNVGPYKDFGKNLEDCLLVGRGPKNWARAIKEVIREDELRNNIINNLRSRIIMERNLDMLVKKRSAIYEKILEG